MKPIKKGRRYDWPSLKAEFMAGDWSTVSQFLKDKGIPLYPRPQTKGWGDEKANRQHQSLIQADEKLLEKETNDIVRIRERQARTARFLQLKGIDALKKQEPESVDEARRLIIGGMEQERKALGAEGRGGTRLTQINIGAKTNLDKIIEGLDYEGILQLIAELKRGGERNRLPKASGGGSGEVEEGEIE